jgi:hypothetical protein
MREKNIVDLRNIYEPEAVREAGFGYVAMGRASEKQIDSRQMLANKI